MRRQSYIKAVATSKIRECITYSAALPFRYPNSGYREGRSGGSSAAARFFFFFFWFLTHSFADFQFLSVFFLDYGSFSAYLATPIWFSLNYSLFLGGLFHFLSFSISSSLKRKTELYSGFIVIVSFYDNNFFFLY